MTRNQEKKFFAFAKLVGINVARNTLVKMTGRCSTKYVSPDQAQFVFAELKKINAIMNRKKPGGNKPKPIVKKGKKIIQLIQGKQRARIYKLKKQKRISELDFRLFVHQVIGKEFPMTTDEANRIIAILEGKNV